MPRNMACGLAVPTTKQKFCSARSTKPRARRSRSRCRLASIAPACCGLSNGTQIIGVRGATTIDVHRRRVDVSRRRRRRDRSHQHHARRRRHSAAGAARPGALRGRPRCSHRRLRDHRQRRQRHLVRECFGRCQRQHHHRYRDDRNPVVRRAGLVGFPQYHSRHQRQRHRDPSHRDRRRRHAGGRQPHRGYQGRSRRLRTIRQRHQRVSRRQCHRPGQPHPQLRLFRRARQFGVEHPDIRQQHQRCSRGRAVFGVLV